MTPVQLKSHLLITYHTISMEAYFLKQKLIFQQFSFKTFTVEYMDTPGWRQGLGKVKNIGSGLEQRGERESKYLLKDAAKNQCLKGQCVTTETALFGSMVLTLRCTLMPNLTPLESTAHLDFLG